jgi:hypothetical protein
MAVDEVADGHGDAYGVGTFLRLRGNKGDAQIVGLQTAYLHGASFSRQQLRLDDAVFFEHIHRVRHRRKRQTERLGYFVYVAAGRTEELYYIKSRF